MKKNLKSFFFENFFFFFFFFPPPPRNGRGAGVRPGRLAAATHTVPVGGRSWSGAPSPSAAFPSRTASLHFRSQNFAVGPSSMGIRPYLRGNTRSPTACSRSRQQRHGRRRSRPRHRRGPPPFRPIHRVAAAPNLSGARASRPTRVARRTVPHSCPFRPPRLRSSGSR